MLSDDDRRMLGRFLEQRPRTIGAALRILGHRAGSAPYGTSPLVTVGSGQVARREQLADAYAVRVPGLLDADDARTIIERLERLQRPSNGPLHVLGTARYQHDDDHRYRRAVRAAEGLIDAVAPGLVDRVIDWCSEFVDSPVSLREGWGPPTLVSIDVPAVGGLPGDVHLDWEGLESNPLGLDVECYSAVLLLRPASRGGGLRLFEEGWFPGTPTKNVGPSVDVEYRIGELLVFEGRRFHQILPMWGDAVRTAFTFHLAHLSQGWRVWL